MNILIYGEKRQELMKLVRSCGAMQYRQIRFHLPNTYDEYLVSLQKEQPELIVVRSPGAHGMEAAMVARDVHSRTPLVWFSNDEAFGAQSYRIDCTYFSAKPVDEATVEDALKHCLTQ